MLHVLWLHAMQYTIFSLYLGEVVVVVVLCIELIEIG